MNKLWSIPVISIYLYAVTILTQYGYYAYFNIPSSFIEASLKENIIYFFGIFQLATTVVGLMRWWMWFVVIFVILFVIFLLNYHSVWRHVISFCGTLLLIYFLCHSYNFGLLLAKNTPEFYVLSSDCGSMNKGEYVIPGFYQGKALMVIIDNKKKVSGDFLAKDLSEHGCATKKEYIGMISK